jgi:hypothetical protein
VPAWNLVIALSFIALSVALAVAPRRVLSAPAWALFRSVVPAWRFFEAIAPPPALAYRVTREGELGPWHEISLALPARTPLSLALDARANAMLACQSLVERLAHDLDAHDPSSALERSVSYRLVAALVRERLAQTDAQPGAQFQFRLADEDGELLVSALHDT